jgi:6-phosphogluconolactonase
MSIQSERIVLPDPAALAERAAQQFIDLAQETITARGRFGVALAGGSTPRRMYELLAQPPYREQVDWSNIHIFWSDERYVPPNDPESNFQMASEALLAHVPIPAAHIYPMPTIGSTPEAAAHSYTNTLAAFFEGEPPRCDLLLLGMGPDGHTASLFPGKPEVTADNDALVIPVYDSPKPPPTRLSFTMRLINAAANVSIFVTGADKATTVRAVLEGPADIARLPIQGVRPYTGALTWFLDAAAAQQLQ